MIVSKDRLACTCSRPRIVRTWWTCSVVSAAMIGYRRLCCWISFCISTSKPRLILWQVLVSSTDDETSMDTRLRLQRTRRKHKSDFPWHWWFRFSERKANAPWLRVAFRKRISIRSQTATLLRRWRMKQSTATSPQRTPRWPSDPFGKSGWRYRHNCGCCCHCCKEPENTGTDPTQSWTRWELCSGRKWASRPHKSRSLLENRTDLTEPRWDICRHWVRWCCRRAARTLPGRTCRQLSSCELRHWHTEFRC